MEKRPILQDAGENGEHASDHYAKKYTSEHIVIARAHYRPTARVPVCRGDRSVVSVFRTQCCGDHVKWLVELLNVLELELKDAIALDLFSGVRKDIRMRIKTMINAPEAS